MSLDIDTNTGNTGNNDISGDKAKIKKPFFWTTASNFKIIRRCFIAVALIMAFVFTAVTAYGGKPSESEMITNKDVFASFTLTDINDSSSTVNESIFADCPLTVINLWYTGCGWCIQEMPDISHAADVFLDRANVIGICVDICYDGELYEENLDAARRILKLRGAKYKNYYPDDELENYILDNVTGYPTTYFVDREGNVIKIITGSLSADGWYSEISALLEVLE